ncbi:MAG: sigma 54-interacting transcriptional regulator [Polyangiaceae bacterium]|nr:sigma 54-interacting transcriptional regulator [Polyangiaceae bacterium]
MTSLRGQQTTLPADAQPAEISGRLWAVEWIFPRKHRTVVGGSPVTLGRGQGCLPTLDGFKVSRQHARIAWDGPVLVVEDLDSRNGTYVDGTRITRAPVGEGSVLRLGEWVGLVGRFRTEDEGSTFGVLAPGMLGGPKLARVLQLVQRAAPSDLPVVVEGETGTGKECVARAVHTWSSRQGPFIAMNCAAVPEALAEGELFGYRKGAFTGASSGSPGHFRSAHCGTLLLDEFAELPLALQAKLLRVLEQREVLPLGESRPVPVDVRVVVAAQEPLSAALAQKRLRADLYARLDGVTIQLPPLRQRIEDVVPLFEHFVLELSGGHPPRVEEDLIEQLCLYDWPFNVRELELVVRRLLVLAGHEPVLRRHHLPARVGGGAQAAPEVSAPSPVSSAVSPQAARSREDEDERDLAALLAELRRQGGNVSRASAAVGLSRARAYRLMNRASAGDLESLKQEALR